MSFLPLSIVASALAMFLPVLPGNPGRAAALRQQGGDGKVEDAQARAELEVASPDGQVQLTFATGADGDLEYRVRYRGAPVLAASQLGFLVDNGPPLARGFRIAAAERGQRDERWRPVAGERREIRDHCNTLLVQLVDDRTPPRALRLEFRAYDEGVALRYGFPGAAGDRIALTDELTEFRFAQDHACWPVYSAQGVYSRRRLAEVTKGCERPLTVDLGLGRWASVGEAALLDFARMRLQPSGQPNGLRADLAGPVTVQLPAVTPWRFVLLADSPGGLIEHNALVLNLNEPCAIADPSWIRPGTVLRDISLTTVGAKACVDFAARMGMRYVEFDAGWYGHEYSDAADARAVDLDPKRSKGPLDLREVIRYGAQHDVGVILYVNRRAMEKQLDELLPLYEQWGVKGVKYGFVNVGPQRWTAWLHDAVRQAAAHHLVVDIHDEYRPTGASRTWPNLLTQEGVRGNEEMPTAEHNLILPFTRFLAGPADATFCWNDARMKTTRAHQLAASIAFHSPLQFLFWYDRPELIVDEPALEFWRRLPTSWTDTRVLEGAVGEFLTIARRSGETWYVGAMNGAAARQVDVALGFLEPGKVYDALVCTDARAADGARALVHVERRQVRASDRLRAEVFASGGCAVRLQLAQDLGKER